MSELTVQCQSTTSVTDKSITSVLILIAMEAEAAPLLSSLGLEVVPNTIPSPCVLHSGKYNGLDLTVATNGKCSKFGVDNVGTTPAALTAFLAINQIKPDLVINAGTAGGFRSKGAGIGDAFISTGIKHHDRRIPIPGFNAYGVGDHVSFDCKVLAESLGFKTGIVTTSNSLDHTPMDDELMLANDATVKDMECAAIAWSAEISSTPFFALKVVTDIVDGDRPTHEEFMENLGTAAKSLQEAVPKIIDFLVGKKLTDL